MSATRDAVFAVKMMAAKVAKLILGFVIGDAFGDGSGINIECGGDGGGASHMGNSRLTGEEAGDSESFVAKTEAGFGTFAVKLGEVDANVGIGRGAVGESFVFAAEIGEVRIVRIVTV